VRDDRERLRHILDAIERIEKYAAKGEKSFRENELIQNWIVHHLQVMGEASRTLSEKFRNAHPEIPWQKIIGMRHVLVHDYFGIDLDIVWRVVTTDLSDFKHKIERVLQSLF